MARVTESAERDEEGAKPEERGEESEGLGRRGLGVISAVVVKRVVEIDVAILRVNPVADSLVALNGQAGGGSKQEDGKHEIAGELPQIQRGPDATLEAEDVCKEHEDGVDERKGANHHHLFGLREVVEVANTGSRCEGNQGEDNLDIAQDGADGGGVELIIASGVRLRIIA